jgi:hypothetical protein
MVAATLLTTFVLAFAGRFLDEFDWGSAAPIAQTLSPSGPAGEFHLILCVKRDSMGTGNIQYFDYETLAKVVASHIPDMACHASRLMAPFLHAIWHPLLTMPRGDDPQTFFF